MAFLENSATWILVSFILFGLVFVRYALPHILKGLDNRADTIRNELDEAVKLKEQASALLADYQRKQKEMHAEAESLLAQAKKDASAMRSQAEQDIATMIKRRTEAAESKIARAEAAAVADIRTHMAHVAVSAAHDVLSKNLSKEEDEALTATAIADTGRILH